MAHLSRTDMEAALAFAALVNEQAVANQHADELLLEALAGMIDFEIGVYSHLDERRRAVLGYAAHPASFEDDDDSADERLEELTWTQNPYCDYRRRTGDWSAVRREDVVDVREYRRTEYFALMAEYSKRSTGSPIYGAVQLWIPTLVGSHRSLNLVRTGREYSMRDRMLLNVLRPLLVGYEQRRPLSGPHAVPALGTHGRLTAREEEVLDLVASGARNAQIAERLWISPDTVRKHLENVYLKLGVSSRTAALAKTGRSRVPPQAARDGHDSAVLSEG